MIEPKRTDADVRDGKESLPEMEDLCLELPVAIKPAAEERLDKALLDTFPASDTPATGRYE
ncbi:hypothetical protein HGP16_20055 [Rhizobium sp. P40RR-XXII]|uniref:hypothetical protein n=1 Tax=Rhizobium sp. P40RR-XXII TaxID=2726739 RepID=UPI001456F0BC|nr:hypothetical protein [Rhizobium sp. P40RR-XXII]NLS18842.1 hypothetical protein [Rhizobium sp. P40RR-XXII]